MTIFWLRDEVRASERRTPIIPSDAARLIEAGHALVVEKSAKRIYGDADYTAIGAQLTETASWLQASEDAVILGLKELPESPATLRHRFIHFAHIFKDQIGWREEIARFVGGGGTLFDIEYLVDQEGKRLAAFSWWAGYIGAAIGLRRLLVRRLGRGDPIRGIDALPDREALEAELRAMVNEIKGVLPRVLVVGAKGKSGRGALALLQAVGVTITAWDKEETDPLDRYALVAHDMLVNCILLTGPGLTLVTRPELERGSARLQVISDVACDPFSEFNPLPIYKTPTPWRIPFITVARHGSRNPVELTAIDNLPSLMPREASDDFSRSFLAALLRFPDGFEWQQSLKAFENAKQRA